MKNLIHLDIEFDEFINNIINFMWEKTDVNLNSIREKLENDILERFDSLFSNLYSNIEKIEFSDSRKAKDFKSVINKSKLDLKKHIEGLSAWFNRLEMHDRNDYVIKDVIDLIKKTTPKVKDKIIVKTNNSIKLKGTTFVYFLDIFENLINNVIKHNEEDRLPEIRINLSIKDETNFLIELSNKVSIKKSILELNNDLQLDRDLFLAKALTKKVSTEGKTGFIKIGRSIKFDLNIEEFDLDFRYISEKNVDFFRVQINFNAKEVLS
jgi:hypothetical protein